MKRIIYIIRTAIILAMSCMFFLECTVKEVEDVYSGFAYIELEALDINISKTEQTVEVPVKTNRTLSFKVTENWVTASLSEDGTCLVLKATANPLETSRTSTITIMTPNGLANKELKVSQDASGELTISGDLILKNHQEVLSNTYTKTKGNLLLGNITRVKSKAVDSSVDFWIDEDHYTASSSDIGDSDIAKLTEQIHLVEKHSLALVNSEVTAFPTDLVKDNSIDRVILDNNRIASLPEADVMASLKLKHLSLIGNSISDVTSLAGCNTLETLDLTGNDVSDLSVLFSLPSLQSVCLRGLPLTWPSFEVIANKYPYFWTDYLDSDASPLPVFDDMKITEIADNKVRLEVKVSKNGGSSITEAGFYIGQTPSILDMKYHKAAYSDGTLSLEYTTDMLHTNIHRVRAYARNASGEGYSYLSSFGSLTYEGDMYLRDRNEIDALYSQNYSHVNGSVFVGNTNWDWNGVILDSHWMAFKQSDLSDLSGLDLLMFVRDGLYIGNTKVSSLLPISKIKGIQTLWLKGNQISDIPDMACSETVTKLDVSRNLFADFSFLAKFPKLESLYLGDSYDPNAETNDIGLLTGLEQYTNLKYIDLSGLPVHQWQVDELKSLMPNTQVVFNKGNRTPHIPTVENKGMLRSESTITLRGMLTASGKTAVTEYGFYYGKDENNLSKIKVGDTLQDGAMFTYDIVLTDDDTYTYYPYAVNASGEGFGNSSMVGNLTSEGDITLENQSKVDGFSQMSYAHINGSLYVGNVSSDIETDIKDISPLGIIKTVKDGIYICNTDVSDIDVLSHIDRYSTLTLRNNKLTKLPMMGSASIKTLDVSGNLLTDFTFLDGMSALETLKLGNSSSPQKETNDIGLISGLEKYTNLKSIDLSGLPVHQWQVDVLRTLMPGTDVIFKSGSRVPWIPTVEPGGVSSSDKKAVLRGIVRHNGKSSVTEYGFYFGKNPDALEKIVVGSSAQDGLVFTHEVSISDEETYYFYPYAVNTYGESRTTVTDFDLSYTDLSRYGTANCYIVRKPGKYMFNATVKGSSAESVGSPASASVVWETRNTTESVSVGDVIKSVGLMDGKVQFEIPEPFVPGNAVIAVKNSAGTILWSWHIWVSDYNPDATAQTYKSGAVMMDRNLGALNVVHGDVLSFGLFYQQGRKDPFIGCADVTSKKFATTAPSGIIKYQSGGSTDKTVQNPYIVYGSYNSSWTDEKNIYDPCPAGWKVPAESVWTGFSTSYMSNTTYGRIFTSPASSPDAYYPLTGDTEMGEQALRSPGTTGYMWTTTSGYAYNFKSCTRTSRSKYDENPVRCVSTGESFAVTTEGIVQSSETSITVKGNLSITRDSGITEKGFVWSTSTSTPSLTDKDSFAIVPGNDSGDFTYTIMGLKPSSRYYIRAYATGNDVTRYGEVIEYVTKSPGSGEGFTGDEFEW